MKIKDTNISFKNMIKQFKPLNKINNSKDELELKNISEED